MADQDEFELKFDGSAVRALDGAPAEAVASSLTALQRMVYIVAMRSEGRALSERLKPTAKVRRNYAVVCRAPREGSHVQPFSIATQSGQVTSDTVAVREKVLRSLKAFDSAEEQKVEQVLPNARERWFMARAAKGLIPPEESGIQIMVRGGHYGRFDFRADRARPLIEKYERTPPPEVEEESVVGKLASVDYAHTIFSIKPTSQPTIRLDYPLPIESWIQANARRRLRLTGKPKYNERGNVSTFKEIYKADELEPTLEPISEFELDGEFVKAQQPVSIPVSVDWDDRLFCVCDKELGINVVSPDYKDLRDDVVDELRVLWHSYALEEDTALDEEAQKIKSNLLKRFRVLAREPA